MSRRFEAPVTPHGILAMVLATTFLAEGILRGELVATLIGFSLAILLVAAFMTVLLARSRWQGFSAGIEKTGDETYRIFPLAAPTIGTRKTNVTRVLFSLSLLRENGNSKNRIDFPLPEGYSAHKPKLPPRGRYAIDSAVCVVSDFAALFSLKTAPVHDLSGSFFTVPPRHLPVTPLEIPASAVSSVGGASSYLRSEELYEVRQYRAGDDPRKINWKVFAHSGDIAIREGELLPPPSSEYAVIFWAPGKEPPRPAQSERFGSMPKLVTRSEILAFETLVSRALSACLDALERGKTLRFPQNGNIVARSDDSNARDLILDALSRPTVRASRAILPEGSIAQNETILCFTLPHRPGKSGNSPDLSSYEAFRDRVIFYVGPEGYPRAKDDSRNKITNPFFENPEEREAREPHVASSDVNRFIARLKRSGYRARTV